MDLPIYIHFNEQIIKFFDSLYENGSKLWVEVEYDHLHTALPHFTQDELFPNNNILNPIVMFHNQKSILAKIVVVYKLNMNLNIIQHWFNKYHHLPQIIIYNSALI